MMNSELEKLRSRKAELEFRLHAIRRDLGRGLDADSEEQAQQLENMEVLQEIGRVAEKELEDVKRQLADLRRSH